MNFVWCLYYAKSRSHIFYILMFSFLHEQTQCVFNSMLPFWVRKNSTHFTFEFLLFFINWWHLFFHIKIVIKPFRKYFAFKSLLFSMNWYHAIDTKLQFHYTEGPRLMRILGLGKNRFTWNSCYTAVYGGCQITKYC